MFIKDLFEAPISDISFMGDWDKNSSFRQQDRKLLSNPKAITKIKAMWKFPEDINFNIICVNHKEAKNHIEIGVVDQKYIAKGFTETGEDILKSLKGDEINVIFTNNNGSEGVPMTGWIMAHRLGHAIQRSRWRYPKLVYYWDEAIQLYIDSLSNLNEHYNTNFSINKRNQSLPLTGPLKYLVNHIGTMKSARDANIRNPYEFLHEMLAQYMITGSIKLNPPPLSFKYRNAIIKRPENESLDDEWIYDIPHQLKDYFETVLYNLVGKILVM